MWFAHKLSAKIIGNQRIQIYCIYRVDGRDFGIFIQKVDKEF